MTRRSIVAGFGNVLRGDDGFGVEVVRRLQEPGSVPAGTMVLEVGTGGIALAQALLDPYQRLVVVDAMQRGGKPGTLYILQVSDVENAAVVDLHMAVPAKVLGLAQALGSLPPDVFMVGCEPNVVDEPQMELSAAVGAAVDSAVEEVRRVLASTST